MTTTAGTMPTDPEELNAAELAARRTRAEAAKLEAEALKLEAETHKLNAEAAKLAAEERKQLLEGYQIKRWERWTIPTGLALLIAAVAATATKVWAP